MNKNAKFKSIIKRIFTNTIPKPGKIKFGHFRRLTPFSREFGYDRGGPVDRYFIERFMNDNSSNIKGKVLEIKDDDYTKRYGGNRVETSDILDIDNQNVRATIIADLAKADDIPDNSYDCIILTQTLLLIYDVKDAIYHCHRILKVGGVILVTVPGITQMFYKELGHTWHWSFTEASCTRLFNEYFSEDQVKVEYHGNVLAATSHLYGISAKELKLSELDYKDPNYQMLITVRAVK